MIDIRKSDQRGHSNHGWLNSYLTFSFANYYDPQFMAFRSLRVINEDLVSPAQGFGAHPHRDMEIISYVLEGALEHKDSLGTGSTIKPGDVQLMCAGTGVKHSEFNPSSKDSVHFLQIWIVPEKTGLKPSYQQKAFDESKKKNRLCLIVSHDAREESLKINQDVDLFASILTNDHAIEYSIKPKRYVWIQLIKGDLTINGQALKQGDGAAISHEKNLTIKSPSLSEFLLFDLP